MAGVGSAAHGRPRSEGELRWLPLLLLSPREVLSLVVRGNSEATLLCRQIVKDVKEALGKAP
eukprot:246871-Rhodomonas_salina.3